MMAWLHHYPTTPMALAPAPAPRPEASLAAQSPPEWAIPQWRRGHQPSALGVKFGKDPKQLGFFLVQMWTYMQEYGRTCKLKGQGEMLDHGSGRDCGGVDGYPPQ